MTPDERADKVLHDYQYSPLMLRRLIADAIRESEAGKAEVCDALQNLIGEAINYRNSGGVTLFLTEAIAMADIALTKAGAK